MQGSSWCILNNSKRQCSGTLCICTLLLLGDKSKMQPTSAAEAKVGSGRVYIHDRQEWRVRERSGGLNEGCSCVCVCIYVCVRERGTGGEEVKRPVNWRHTCVYERKRGRWTGEKVKALGNGGPACLSLCLCVCGREGEGRKQRRAGKPEWHISCKGQLALM